MKLLAKILLSAMLSGPAWAAMPQPIYMPHDSGLGKSQDGTDDGSYDEALGSVSVAPEPATYILFLLGGLMVIYSIQRRRTD